MRRPRVDPEAADPEHRRNDVRNGAMKAASSENSRATDASRQGSGRRSGQRVADGVAHGGGTTCHTEFPEDVRDMVCYGLPANE